MYLTDKKNNKSRELSDHEELEVLLESFAKQVEEIVNEAESIQVIGLFVKLLRDWPVYHLTTDQRPIDTRDR